MAGAITAASIKYGEPFVTKVGGVLFSVTEIETSATLEEYVEGGIEILPEKLGLTDGLISVSSGTSGTASTTALAGAIWCNPILTTAKLANEEGKLVTEGAFANITLIKGVPFLRVYSQTVAAKGELVETKTATKQLLKSFSVTIFAFGR